MKLFYFLLFALLFLPAPSGAQQPGSSTASPTPQTEAQVIAQLDAQDATLMTLPKGTTDRAQAAGRSQNLATALAWHFLSAGKYDAAHKYFQISADRAKEAYDSRQAFYENECTRNETMIAEQQKELAAITDNQRNAKLLRYDRRILIANFYDSWITTLNRMCVETDKYNDTQAKLNWAQQALALRQTEIAELPTDAEKPTNFPVPLIDKSETQIKLAVSFETLADAQTDASLSAQAEHSYQQALAIRSRLFPAYPQANPDETLKLLGDFYDGRGDWDKAQDYYLKAGKALGKEEPVITGFFAAGPSLRLRQLKDPKRIAAEQKYDARQAKFSLQQREVYLLLKIGSLQGEKDDHASELSYYGQAWNLVNSYEVDVNQYVRSLGFDPNDSKKLPQIRKIPPHVKSGNTNADHTIDDLNQELPDMEAFLEYYGVLFEKTGCLGYAVVACEQSGEMDRAMLLLNQMVAVKGVPDSTDLLIMTKALYDHDAFQAAHDCGLQALFLFSQANEKVAAIRVNQILARTALMQGDVAGAEEYALSASALAAQTNTQKDIGIAAGMLARVRLAQKKFPEAATLLATAETAAHTPESPSSLANVFDLKGQIFEGQGNFDSALKAYGQAVDYSELARSLTPSASLYSDLKGSTQIYDHIISLLVALGRNAEALDYLHREHTQKLRESLPLISLKTKDTVLQGLLDSYRNEDNHLRLFANQRETATLPARQHSLTIQIQQMQTALGETSRKIKKINPNYAQILEVKHPLLRTWQAQISPRTVLIEYAFIQGRLTIFTVTQTQVKAYPTKITQEMVSHNVGAFLDLMEQANRDYRGGKSAPITNWMSADPDVTQLRTVLTELYTMLISPVEADIKQAQEVSFVPSGILYYLPFQALAYPQGDTLRFLIQDRPISYLCSADVHKAAHPITAGTHGRGLLAIDALTPDELPETHRETRESAQTLRPSVILSGPEARKNVFLSAENQHKRSWLIATHSHLSPFNALDSYVQLAPSRTPGEDRLTLGEVVGYHLDQVDLIVLSACETARGEDNPDGTDIMSLGYVFTSCAHASSTMAGLWSVADESSRKTIVTFYKNWAAGHSKAGSLQQAQIEVMNDPNYRNPYYWAPFILMGDWH